MKSLPEHELKKHIKEIYENPQVGILNLNKKLKDNKNIIKFDLSDMLSKVGVDDKSQLLINIARALKDTSVTHFEMEGLKLQNASSFDFINEFKFTSINSLSICDNVVSPEAAAKLSENLAGTKVLTLYFYSNKLGDDGIASFGKNVKSTNLICIHASENDISDKGIIEFSKYVKGSKLTSLHLNSNKIFAAGATEVAKSLPGSLVTFVDLSKNGLGDEGAMGFTANLKGSNVSDINLSSNVIGDSGAIGVIRNLIGTEVTTLDLSHNKITTQGVKTILKLIKLTNLTSVDFGFNQLTAQDFQLINKALQGNAQLNPLARAYLPSQKPPVTPYTYFLALPLKYKIGLVAGVSLLLGVASYALGLMALTVSTKLSIAVFASLGGLAAAVGYWRKNLLAYVNNKYILTDKQKHKIEIETVKAQVLPYTQQLDAKKNQNLITAFAEMLAKVPSRSFDAHGAAVPNTNLSFTRLEALRFQSKELGQRAAMSQGYQSQYEDQIVKIVRSKYL